MALSRTVREQAKAFLPPGDELRYLLAGMAMRSDKGLVPANCLIAISNSQVIVLGSGAGSRYKPTSVWARFPRAIQLGPIDSRPAPTIELGELLVEIDDEYIPLVLAADAEIGDDFLPPDPLPDL